MIDILKTPDDVFLFLPMAYELCIQRNLNVADFQCKPKGKYIHPNKNYVYKYLYSQSNIM